jgi:hypothetical protein
MDPIKTIEFKKKEEKVYRKIDLNLGTFLKHKFKNPI